jgi:hypothetical protein
MSIYVHTYEHTYLHMYGYVQRTASQVKPRDSLLADLPTETPTRGISRHVSIYT